jgi:GT2 family glycosyltransferase
MEQAEGDFFIFLDSDTLVDPDWLNAIDEAVKEGADAFGGPDGASADFTPLQKAINYSMTSFLTTGGIRGKKKSIGKYYPRSFNMGLRREIYEKVGGFQEQQYGEDIDFSKRIYNAGAKVEFVEDAVVYHKRRSSLFSFIRQVFKMGKARSVLVKDDPELLEPVYVAPSAGLLISVIVIPLAMAGSAIATLLVIIGFAGLFLIALHSYFLTKSLQSALYIPIIIPAQVFGYGLGFIRGFINF